jgi:hypothetical protein
VPPDRSVGFRGSGTCLGLGDADAACWPAALCWLRRPQPQNQVRKVTYDAACGERGQVKPAKMRRKPGAA